MFVIRIIKLTSPTINYFIISGAMFMYCSVFFYEFPFNESTQRAVALTVCLVSAKLMEFIYAIAIGFSIMIMHAHFCSQCRCESGYLQLDTLWLTVLCFPSYGGSTKFFTIQLQKNG